MVDSVQDDMICCSTSEEMLKFIVAEGNQMQGSNNLHCLHTQLRKILTILKKYCLDCTIE